MSEKEENIELLKKLINKSNSRQFIKFALAFILFLATQSWLEDRGYKQDVRDNTTTGKDNKKSINRLEFHTGNLFEVNGLYNPFSTERGVKIPKRKIN